MEDQIVKYFLRKTLSDRFSHENVIERQNLLISTY